MIVFFFAAQGSIYNRLHN